VPAARVFFVTGTDTDVGKTVIAGGLLRAAGLRGLRTLAIKPVAAGCRTVDGRLVNDDALLLQREAGDQLAYEDVNPVALEPAIAPHIAAARAGVDLSRAALLSHCRLQLEAEVDLAVIEGAGGWLVPLNDTETLADLCEGLAADVVLVVGVRLGCLNHALLTAADVGRRGLQLAGWVANCIDPGMPELEANLETLERRLEAPCLGRIPFAAGQDPVALAAKQLDLTRLLGEPT
jgi:dethiobiotin synthetase